MDQAAREIRSRRTDAGVSHVILLEGTNDIGRATTDSLERVTAEDIIFGERQLATRAHERHVVVVCGTLTPVGGNRNYGRPPVPHSAQAESMRRDVNHWIRTSKTCDHIVDFDEVVRDPERPDWRRAAFDSGDHIHLNAAGYEAMGRAIDLAIFNRAR